MSSAHYTDNPTDLTETTRDGNPTTVSDCNNPSAHSRLRSPFDHLPEQASPTGYEPNDQLDDMTSNNFASMQSDSGLSSIGSSSTPCSETEFVATTIPVTDSMNQAPKERLWQRGHKRRFPPGEGCSSREANRSRSWTILQGHEALHQQQR